MHSPNTEYLLCARNCSKQQGERREQNKDTCAASWKGRLWVTSKENRPAGGGKEKCKTREGCWDLGEGDRGGISGLVALEWKLEVMSGCSSSGAMTGFPDRSPLEMPGDSSQSLQDLVTGR